ncbi:MAG: bifunctional enoyl-CoA hydratase/phosphate acetyltransferase [Helicobacter sp.]|nr:bifunctional enoyl-CoA hydratase/phosphate acetyltransferase [Helicobacter sp.]
MSLKNFDEILSHAKSTSPINVAVIQPNDQTSLSGALDAQKEGLITPIFIGRSDEIQKAAQNFGFNISNIQIIDAKDDVEAANTGAKLAGEGKAQAIMKGSLHTNDLMSAVLKRENNLRTDAIISHAFVMQMPTYNKPLIITDAAINIAPDVKARVSILRSAIYLARKMGIKVPKAAVLSAVESPYPKMPSSIEAKEIVDLTKELEKDVIIEGPLAFDNAISSESCKIKKIDSKLAGDVDILLTPQIESGNILFKALVYLANASVAGVVLGAKVPIILTSRSDSAYSRMMSAALAKIAAQ